ncbi:pisatin demethylase [Aspergillus heteromorphus CBS 117.55]|uniref:Pisatin demethylase n=1 Tax=Aspergillus heteromorphus CBS 117.55 TaxID=1448321 RepID=A0A317WS43_9EURO|nr:pisatin demethylase [Aspergillus heteromorphus CBS 117.55]PWY88551.1 pisatin demethylase [Aspergillus heteromorphus CBS 117.55]
MVSTQSVVLSLGILFLLYFIKAERKLAAFPGPAIARYTDWWKVYRHWKGDYVEVMSEWHKKHGPFIRNGPNSLCVGGVENARKVYQTNPVLKKGSVFKTMVTWYKGRSVSGLEAILDENEHTTTKRMVSKTFTPVSVMGFESKMDQCTLEFIGHVEERGSFDMAEWFVYYFADMMNDIAFSAKPGFMEHATDVDGSLYITKVITLTWARVHAIPTIMSWLSWALGYMVGLNWKVVRLGRECLNSRLEKPDPEKTDLLNVYIEAGQERPDMISPERVLGMTLSTIIGGSDITAFTVTYGLSEILKNQNILSNIEQEIKGHELSYPPSIKELSKLPYLNAIVKETLRLSSPVQFNLDRVTPDGGMEMGGTHIPAGTTVGCLQGIINHDEVFGSDVTVFRPERWIEASEEKHNLMERSIMAFGMGKHTCIGQHFANAQLRKIIATLLMRFEVSAVDPHARLVWNTRTFLRHPQSYYISVKRRQSIDVAKA